MTFKVIQGNRIRARCNAAAVQGSRFRLSVASKNVSPPSLVFMWATRLSLGGVKTNV